jgi:hypothetical protein
MFKENKIDKMVKIRNPMLRAFRNLHVIRSCNDMEYVLDDSEIRCYSRFGGMHALVGLRICLKRIK